MLPIILIAHTQYIRGHCIKYPTTTRTISFWYKGTDSTLNNDVFGYGGDGNCGTSWITIFANNVFGVAGHCSFFDTFDNKASPLYNYWHNVIISYDGTNINIYIDGCMAISSPRSISKTVVTPDKFYYIGAIPDQGGVNPYNNPIHHYWEGDLDDVGIWDRELTDQEITVVAQPVCQPRISISKNSGDTICLNTPVTFTAKAINNLLTPNYQWKLNNTNVGSNSSTYSTHMIANGDFISCILLNATICSTDKSNSIRMTVNANQPVSVSISSDDTDRTICAGTSVTFTAAPTNGGISPSYQWKVNGNNVGTNSSTYTTASLVNNAILTCILTSDIASCSIGNPVTSNSIQMTVTANQPVSVSISSNDSDDTICAGSSVTFTAAPTNGGISPSYQWKINGNNIGTNSSTYTAASLANNAIVTCTLTSNIASCSTGNPATSNSIQMTVNANLPLSVSISSGDDDNIICAGASVTFTAIPTNGGTSPSFQWKINGSNVGTNNSIYTTASLANNDIVTCILTSNISSCLIGNPATSNSFQMTVNPNQSLSVSISSDDDDNIICAGSSVIFTATPTNGDISPYYQWKVNGSNVGTNNSIYKTASLTNNAIVTCILTSNIASCATANPAASNSIQMTVNPNLSPGIHISSDDADNIICKGTPVTFTVTPVNEGTKPSYSWKLNGINVGINSPLYTPNTFANGDVVSCIMTSNATCVTTRFAGSNNIMIHIPASVNLGKDISLCISDYFNLNVADSFLSYQWNTGSDSKSIKVVQSGIYWLHVQDSYGCISSDTINITEKTCGFFIPNAFTPNHDGRNDVFKPVLSGTILAYKFLVYNRWGIKVFETTDLLKGWDGSFKEQMQSSNAFVWICEYQFAGQPRTRKKGTVLLIR